MVCPAPPGVGPAEAGAFESLAAATASSLSGFLRTGPPNYLDR
jgi:hypothetical protein